MNSPTQPPVESVDIDEQANPDNVDGEAKAEIPAFKFPFKPGELAEAKKPANPGTRTAPRTVIPRALAWLRPAPVARWASAKVFCLRRSTG